MRKKKQEILAVVNFFHKVNSILHYSKNMLDQFFIFVFISFILAQGSSISQDKMKYKHDEKYALVSFASQKFLENPELMKMYSAFYGALYKEKYFKNKKNSSPKKILSLYEIQDFMSPRKKENLKQNYLSTEFQVETRDGAVYQIPFWEAFRFRNRISIENSFDCLSNSLFQANDVQNNQNSMETFFQTQPQPNSSQGSLTFWHQMAVVWDLIKKKQFRRLFCVLQYRFKTISQIKKLFFAIGILLFSFFKILQPFFEFISFFGVITNYLALQLRSF